MDVQLLNKPDDIIQELQSVPGIYLIKIKCISCSEDAYIDYKDPEIYQNTLRIGVHSFPLNLIERRSGR